MWLLCFIYVVLFGSPLLQVIQVQACGTNEFSCTNGVCILGTWRCDGDRDCADNSDELMCSQQQTTCDSDDFMCSDGSCILGRWRCDGDQDCADGSDEELNCLPACDSNEVRCANGDCIHEVWKCDGDQDCMDGSDEFNCSRTCGSREFSCANGDCIQETWRCDGDQDCRDGSDELQCVQLSTPSSSTCGSREFMCTNGNCIHASWRCDGDQDCADGSDEIQCSQPSTPASACGSREFMCTNGDCIHEPLRCDGEPDCSDGSDESESECAPTSMCNSRTQFQCGNGNCIDLSLVCNGNTNCNDKTDEPPGDVCSTNECKKNNGGCNHECNDLPIGYFCSCFKGFEMGENNKTCFDINECMTHPPPCSQTCHNNEGSFSCNCIDGFARGNDGKTCRALGPDPLLVFANRRDIREVNVHTTEHRILFGNLRSAVAVDFHFESSGIYWTDVADVHIQRGNITELDDSGNIDSSGDPEVIIDSDNVRTPDGLAIDWIHDNLYWTDTGLDKIMVSNLDGSKTSVVIDSALDEPRAIVVDPRSTNGNMFWSDWGVNARIERAGMNGKERDAIVTQDITWPNGLAIDYYLNRLFWVDAKLNTISCCDFYGGNRYTVIDSDIILPHPFSIDVFEDYVYWTDWETNSITKANKFDGTNREDVLIHINSPMNLKVLHPLRQANFSENDCGTNNGGCSYLCVGAPYLSESSPSTSCMCPEGFDLIDDYTCTGPTPHPSLMTTPSITPTTQAVATCPSFQIKLYCGDDGDRAHCLPLSWICDGDADCDNGADEEGCSDATCPPNAFQCDNNRCIPQQWRCDKQDDCGDYSDELLCSQSTVSEPPTPTSSCGSREFMCSDGDCIHASWRCDGDQDCPDSSDEFQCSRPSTPSSACSSREFMCNNEDCIHKSWRCDGEQDCSDGSDEWKCVLTSVCDSRTHFQCGNGNCIDLSLVCNGKNDCTDQSDEPRGDVCSTNECTTNNGGCEHKCNELPIGYFCSCYEGFVMGKNNDTCLDINECRTYPPPCSQTCHNSEGSFLCKCSEGFVLGKDGKKCRASGRNPLLIFTTRYDIRGFNIETREYRQVFKNLRSAVALDFHLEGNSLYWTDVVLKDSQIQRGKVNGRGFSTGDPEAILDSEIVVSIEGIAVDWIHDNLYWADNDLDEILVSTLDGFKTSVVVENVNQPRALVVEPRSGYIFWTDWGNNPRIERAGLNGKERDAIVTQDILWPNGLAIDYYSGRLFWVDAKLHTISSCDFYGGNRYTVIDSDSILPHPFSIDVFEDYVYWTDWRTDSIQRANKFDGSDREELVTMLSSLMNLRVVHPLLQPNFSENDCEVNNGGCSYMCVAAPRLSDSSPRTSCLCPPGHDLIDEYNCEQAVLAKPDSIKNL